jgi:hypothetical protein
MPPTVSMIRRPTPTPMYSDPSAQMAPGGFSASGPNVNTMPTPSWYTPGQTDDQTSATQASAAGQATQNAQGRAGSAYDAWGTGIGTAAGFQPTNTAGVSNAVDQWNPGGGSGATGAFMGNEGDYWNAAQKATGGVGGVSASTANLAGTNFDKLENYDPSAAVNQWATGAWSGVKQQLGDDLTATRNHDASLGRLNTGFFDKDRGMVMTRATQGFNNALAEQAVNASGQKLSALNAGAGYRLNRAGQMDSLTTQANVANGQLSLGKAQLASSNAWNAGRLGLDAAQTYDAGELARGQDANSFGLNRANYLDSSLQNAGQYGASQYGQRAGLAQSGYQNDRDFFGELTSGRQDREQQRVQMDRDNNTAKANTVIGAAGTLVNGLTGGLAGKIGGGIKKLFHF